MSAKKRYYCIDCGKEISIFSGFYGQGRCGSCAMKRRFKNPENHPRFGKHNTAESKKKVSCLLKGIKRSRETKAKISKANSGKKPSLEARKKMSKAHKGQKSWNEGKLGVYSAKTLKLMSKRQLENPIRYWLGKKRPSITGKKNYHFGKPLRPHWGMYKGINMRSNWEIWFAQFLDLSGCKWRYESKTFDLGKTTYTPDFYIPEWNQFIEIKGYFSQKAIDKIDLFKEQYPKENLRIFKREDLKKIGVIV